MARPVDMAVLAASVERVAALLGEDTGSCVSCARPVRLVGAGLVPAHKRIEGRQWCAGGDLPPAEAGEVGRA